MAENCWAPKKIVGCAKWRKIIKSSRVKSIGVENQVAMFLLPEGTTAGSRLVREMLEWRLL